MSIHVIRIVVLMLTGLGPVAAAAQPGPVAPVPPPLRAPAHTRSAWFERYQEDRKGPETSDQWSRTFKVGPNGSLDLSNISGEIVVVGGGGDEIRVDATRRVRTRDGNPRQQLEAFRIEATENGGRVEIRTLYPRMHNVQGEVDFSVQVPAGTAVAVHTISGDVRVSKVKGEVRLESVSGTVTAVDTAQLSRIKSVSGNVEVTDVASGDMIAAGSVSGNVTTRRVKARSIDAQTVSGDLQLTETVCDRAQVRSVSGDVEFGGPLLKGGRYEFNSHSGDVRVMISGGSGFELTANTFSGELQSELPFVKTSGGGDQGGFPGMPKNRELRGTVGDGSALLIVKTFSGDLMVMKGGAGPKRKDKE
jgi:hypothetical protein